MKVVLSPKNLLSSPIVYAAIGYLAAMGALLAQDAVVRGDLVPGSPTSNFLANTIVPLTLVGPVTGIVFGVYHYRSGKRQTESALGIVGAIPLLLLWLLAFTRAVRHGVLAT